MGTRLRDRLSSTCGLLERREESQVNTRHECLRKQDVIQRFLGQKTQLGVLGTPSMSSLYDTDNKHEQPKTLPQNPESHRLQAWALYKQY